MDQPVNVQQNVICLLFSSSALTKRVIALIGTRKIANVFVFSQQPTPAPVISALVKTLVEKNVDPKKRGKTLTKIRLGFCIIV